MLNELLALEKVCPRLWSLCLLTHLEANIHSFLETDDRILTVLKYIDDAVTELNSMEEQVTSYKIQLNVGGSGTSNPPTVEIPGAYSAEDPGILINIYTSLTAYTSQYFFLHLRPSSFFLKYFQVTKL